MERTQEKLDVARKELLDLSLRNKLLNYRPLKTKGVEVVDELPEEVFRILVADGLVMSFLAKPEEDEEEDEESGGGEDGVAALEQPEEEDINGVAERHRDKRLQTPYTSANLQKRLLNTFYTARTYLEEQGVNVLYLALGMLNWYESESSSVMRKAPLILVPVELYRTNVRSRFRMRYTEDEVGDNLSLRARLRADFGLKLPSLPVDEDIDVPGYFDQVEQLIEHQPRWEVDRSAIALAFFSFGTFLMYNDLDADNWPEGEKPAEHPLLQAILEAGFQEPPAVVADDEQLDEHVSPKENFQVVDADSSQTLAILDVNQGRNLVIQGPPGTGKSQTITNLIAEALGQDRTVLFVAEKMAALEVVKRRLDQVGLGAACLELHSHKTNKKAFLEELQRTLELGKPRKRDHSGDLQALEENRDRLNAYCEAVNTPVGRSGVTPYQAYGRLLYLSRAMQDVKAPPLDDAVMRDWEGITFRKWLERVEGLQTLLARMGAPAKHPFWGSKHTSYLRSDRRELRAACQAAGKAVHQLQQSASQLAQHLDLPAPGNREEVIKLVQAGETALAAPPLDGVRVRDQAWLRQAQVVKKGVVLGARLADLHSKHDKWLLPEAWEQDVLEIRTAYANYGDKWWRFLSGDFRRARRALVGLVRSDLPQSVSNQMALVEGILEAQRLQRQLDELDPLLSRLFGDHWRGDDSDWERLADTADWFINLYSQIDAGSLPPSIVDYLAATPDFEALRPLVADVEEALDAHGQAAPGIAAQLQLSESVRFGEGGRFIALSFAEQQRTLKAWYTEVDRLQEMVSFNHQARQLREAGLGKLVAIAAGWDKAGEQLANLFQRTWYEMLVKRAMTGRPALAMFNGDIHLHRIERFRDADQLTFRINRTELAHRHWEQLPRHTAGGQLGILHREFAKKRRHLPIRRLMERAGRVIQTIKPVFMMSPMSIAQFLPPGTVDFDLVVFDEASQVRPVDAFGAILRGRQAVVVGDSKQLPPTHFFSQIVEAEDEEMSPTADLESVLGLFSAQGAPQRMLRWHYRSQHESLIAVSNYEFYDNRLVLFPSPVAERKELGLVFHHLPDTIYDRGRSRTNRDEARAVAKKVMEHARSHPNLTLGVAAFSVSQMEAIQDQLEILRRQDPSCETFFNSHQHEPFFVKNLENVQGDERDVIFISVGYGRDRDGKLTMNFGPINKDGGERRLNVLTTRARLRCEIFSNLTDEDIDLSRTDARGAVALKRYLKFARTGELDMPTLSDGDAESLFEAEVAQGLREQGYDVAHQVGSAGFSIDLAIRDKERPGRYILGIECDGATYHSARSARDRDRLRQQVLEGMGWQIHRIWSTDWFRNPPAELRRTVEAIEAAKTQVSDDGSPVVAGAGAAAASSEPIERQELTQEAARPQAADYQLAKLHIHPTGDLHETNRRQMAEWVNEVVSVESPVHFDDVARRITDAAGVSRLGRRIRAAIEDGVGYAVLQGAISRRGDFLWKGATPQLDAVRSHANLPDYSRDIGQIAPEEIVLAIETVVKSAFGMQQDDIPAEVCTLLGFGRTSQAMRDHVEGLIDRMVAAERLVEQGGFLVVADGD